MKQQRKRTRKEPDPAPRPPKCIHPAGLVIENESMDGQISYHKCLACGEFWKTPAELRRREA